MKHWNFWTLTVLGLWLIVSPWALGFSLFNLVRWNCIFTGILILIVSLSRWWTSPRGE